MLYSIQNSGGHVYGIFEMPPSTMSPDVWAAELRAELGDILGINGVTDSPLMTGGDKRIKVDRVVIDIEPVDEDNRLAKVHETIGRLAGPIQPN